VKALRIPLDIPVADWETSALIGCHVSQWMTLCHYVVPDTMDPIEMCCETVKFKVFCRNGALFTDFPLELLNGVLFFFVVFAHLMFLVWFVRT